jgi:hypothetical protein
VFRDVGCRFSIAGDVPLRDPGPSDDPLIGRADESLQIGVRENLIRS